MFSFLNEAFSKSSGAGYITEMEQIISQLERGTLVTKYSEKKPENKMMMIRRETRQIVFKKTVQANQQRVTYDGTVDLREIKEVRLGKGSKDFEKWVEDAKKIDMMKCFVVYYGSEFKLKALSISCKFANLISVFYMC